MTRLLPNLVQQSNTLVHRVSGFVKRLLLEIFAGIKTAVVFILNIFHIQNIAAWLRQFNPSQWCYLLAACLLILHLLSGFETILWVAFIAFIGLIRELLNIFHRVWEHSIGKGVIVILYASTANLALAFAALKINTITGIEPTPFVFTLGFTTLMLMPFWIALSSILIFLMVLALANLWFLLSLLLRVLGLKISVHWEDKKWAVLSLFLRIVLIPLVLVMLLKVMVPFVNSDFLDSETWSKLNEEGIFLSINTGAENGTGEISEGPVQDAPVIIASDELNMQGVQNDQKFIETIIANFIFYFESYPKSACMKAEEQRSVMINEDLVLLISKNPEAPHGFDYEVQECLPRLLQ